MVYVCASGQDRSNGDSSKADLMLETAKYAVKKYKEMKEGNEDDN